MVYFGIIPFRKPKSISTEQLVLLLISFPIILAILFAIAYFLSKYITCPMLQNTSPLCGGAYNVGMLLITFFVFFIIAFIIFFSIIIKKFSSQYNLKNLSQYQDARKKMLQMVKDSNPNITDEELERITKQAGA